MLDTFFEKLNLYWQVLSTSTGLTKTVYNPAALKAAQKTLLVSTSAVDNNEAQKKKQVSIVVYRICRSGSFSACMCFFSAYHKIELKERYMLAATELLFSLVYQ